MPKQMKHSDPNTPLGQLQPGREEGYRRAVAVPKREAWDCLLDCIRNDPRLDGQVEIAPIIRSYSMTCSISRKPWSWRMRVG